MSGCSLPDGLRRAQSHTTGELKSMISRVSALSSVVVGASCCALLASCPAWARPLDLEQCARLKTQRDALEAAGVRSSMKSSPPPRATRTLDEPNQRIRTLIQLDGQLRFRCNIEMPIASLKPELLVDVPDTVDGVAATPAPKRPAPKRTKAVSEPPATAPVPASSGVAAPQRAKTAGATGGAAVAKATPPSTEPSVVKARPKPKTKLDDAFRAPATPDANSPQ